MTAFKTSVTSLLLACSLWLGGGALAATMDLPPGALGGLPFLWGVTLAGYQNDGAAPAMDWYAYERDGKSPEPSGKGADFRGHLEADLDRAQSLGLNSFRMSLEWARLEPTEGHLDAEEIAFIHRMLTGMRQRGMRPVITLYHFATPLWAYRPDAEGRVGWESPATVAAYLRYVAFVAKEFGSDIDLYLTFNEPSSVILGGYAAGFIPPHRIGPVAMARATANVQAAHEGAYETIHRLDPVAMVSIPDYNCELPVAGARFDFVPGRWFVSTLGETPGWDGAGRPKYLDFTAIHYYGTNHAFTAYPVQPEHWEGNPAHFGKILRSYYAAQHLPILVAENGFATHDNQPRDDGWTRESYLVAHIQAIQDARTAGIPVMGYMYWTLTDNYEWGSFSPRFGLWRVEARTGDYTRYETPAAGVYREIIHQGGVTAALRARYPAPVRR